MTNKGNSLKKFVEEHHNREDLAPEHPYGDAGQIVAFIIFLMVWTLDSFIFKFSTMLASYISLYVRFFLAALCFGYALYVAKASHGIIFKEMRDPPQVIQTGVFARVRHPLYLAALLFYLGFFLMTLSLISLAFFAGIFLFYNYIATFEEKQLEQKFGQEYTDYKEKTPKWLPSLKSGGLH